jgi:hypothetical protein
MLLLQNETPITDRRQLGGALPKSYMSKIKNNIKIMTMKCLICKAAENETPNHFLPLYVLLGFLYRKYKSTDMGGVHYSWWYVFTPLAKTTIESYFCDACKQKLNAKNRRNRKRSIIWLIITVSITIAYNYLVTNANLGFFYYLINIVFLIGMLVCIEFIIRNEGFSLLKVLKASDELKSEIERITNKIDFSKIKFLDLEENERMQFLANKEELAFCPKDLSFYKQNCSIIKGSNSFGTDGTRDWFKAPASSTGLSGDLMYGGHRLQRTSDHISKEFENYSKNKVCSLQKYDKIKEL